MVLVCYLLLKLNKQNIHINVISSDRNFDHPHINVVTLVPRKQFKSHDFSTIKKFFAEKTFHRYLSLGLSSCFSQNSPAFLKHCYFVVVSFKNRF